MPKRSKKESEEEEEEKSSDKKQAKESEAPPAKKKKTEAVTMTVQDFLDDAKEIKMTFDGKDYLVKPKQLKTGSVGWNTTNKLKMNVNGQELDVQLTFSATVINSKKWIKGKSSAKGKKKTARRRRRRR